MIKIKLLFYVLLAVMAGFSNNNLALAQSNQNKNSKKPNYNLTSYEITSYEKINGYYSYQFKTTPKWQIFQVTIVGENEDDLFDLVINSGTNDIRFEEKENPCWLTNLQTVHIFYSPPFSPSTKTHCVLLNTGAYYLKIIPHKSPPQKVFIQKVR